MIGAVDVVKAGGIVALGAKLDADVRVGVVGARQYEHDALPGRVVVRLVADVVAPGVDVEMETLGFTSGKVDDKLGKQRFRALGFPGWPLVHDPKRAKFALEVMKDFKKAAKQVPSKPGNAKDEFVAIGERLGRSVPHFLPSFWEEVGRAFMAHENTTYAAQSFEKARTAEREHALAIDEEVRSGVYLEFALGGAVSAKSLAGYAGVLEEAYGAAAAYPRYFELAVRRVLGGMPPWTGLAKELRGLAKSAQKKVAEEDERFLVEVLDAPAIARSPVDFWVAYRDALVRLAKARPEIRSRIRDLSPQRSTAAAGFPVQWIQMLEEAGVIDDVVNGAPSAPDESAATWLSGLIGFTDAAPEVCSLFERLAPRIIREGEPVQMGGSRTRGWCKSLNLDACERAMIAGIPLADPQHYALFDLTAPCSCDPVHVARDRRFAARLLDGVERALGSPELEELARTKKAISEARGIWLSRELERMTSSGLHALREAATRMMSKCPRSLYTEFPDAIRALKNVDAAVALARTVREGLFAEFTWPAFERAYAKLAGETKSEITQSGAWPHPVLHNDTKAIVLGPDGPVFEHDFVLPPKASLQMVLFVEGDLFVTFWSRAESASLGYWASAPHDAFALDSRMSWYDSDLPTSFTLPQGGVTFGGSVFHRGDRVAPTVTAFSTDATTFWVREWEDGRMRMREIDPSTGAKGRASWPAFAREASERTDELRITEVEVLPAVPGTTSSPCGVKDGLLGTIFRRPSRHGRGKGEIERIDGPRYQSDSEKNDPKALVTWPGDGRPRPIHGGSSYSGQRQSFQILDTKGEIALTMQQGTYGAAGWPGLPSLSLWHFLATRDPKGSAALRAFSEATGREIIAAAHRDRASDKSRSAQPAIRAALAASLPDVKAPELVDAIAATALEAVDCELLVRELADRAESPETEVVDAIDDDDVMDALVSIHDHTWSGESFSAAFAVAAKYLAGESVPAQIPGSRVVWAAWVGSIRGFAVYATLAGLEDKERSVITRVLRLWAATALAEDGPKLRHFTAKIAPGAAIRPEKAERWVASFEASRYAFSGEMEDDGSWAGMGVERPLDGTFRLPPGVTIDQERTVSVDGDRAWLRAFLDAFAARGAPAWDPRGAEVLAKESGLSRAESTLLLAGLPKMKGWAADFLGKPLRERLDIKMGDAKIARDTFRPIGKAQLRHMYAQAAPDDPTMLFTAAVDAADGLPARLGRAWSEVFGRRAAVDEALALACEKDLDPSIASAALLAALDAPSEAPFLRIEPPSHDTLFGYTYGAPKHVSLDGDALQCLSVFVPWVYHTLPVGHASRDRLPAFWESVVSRLADRSLALKLAWVHPGGDEKLKFGIRALVEAVGGEPISIAVGADQAALGFDTGAVMAGLFADGTSARFAFRPALLEDPLHAHKLVMGFPRYFDGALGAVAILRSDGVKAMMKRIKKTPVPEGGFEANPAASAPEVVAEVARAKKISPEAAAHYLQLLALAEPTGKAVQLWNGWDAKAYKATATELLAKKLVVGGKRERAGREIFLPGAWDKSAKGKNLPTEAWKLSFYTTPFGPLSRRLPSCPHHELFEAAWTRVRKGDAPKLEEVGT